MFNTKLIAVPALMGALFIAATGQQAKADNSTATLTVDNFTSVTTSGNVAASPTLSQIQTGVVDTDGLTLGVGTNNQSGCKVTVSALTGDVTSNTIAAGDIFLKVVSPGTGGVTTGTFAGYTALDTVGADLWNTTSAKLNGVDVGLDVEFRNLAAYPAKGGNSTDYTNTITFTAVANS